MTANGSIAALFDQWNNALQTLDPDQVVELYSEDAILLPTLSNTVRHNHAELRKYFVNFLQKKPRGTINESNFRDLGDIAIHSGIYTFTLEEDGQTSDARCRFTYVYRKLANQWKIIEHHSSLMPE